MNKKLKIVRKKHRRKIKRHKTRLREMQAQAKSNQG